MSVATAWERKQDRELQNIQMENIYDCERFICMISTDLMPRGKSQRHMKIWMKGNSVYVLCWFGFGYLWVEADLADVTGDDWPLGLDQRNPKGVVDHSLLHRVHLRKWGDTEKKTSLWAIIHTLHLFTPEVMVLKVNRMIYHKDGEESLCHVVSEMWREDDIFPAQRTKATAFHRGG